MDSVDRLLLPLSWGEHRGSGESISYVVCLAWTPGNFKGVIHKLFEESLQTRIRLIFKGFLEDANKRSMISDHRKRGVPSKVVLALLDGPLDGQAFKLNRCVVGLCWG